MRTPTLGCAGIAVVALALLVALAMQAHAAPTSPPSCVVVPAPLTEPVLGAHTAATAFRAAPCCSAALASVAVAGLALLLGTVAEQSKAKASASDKSRCMPRRAPHFTALVLAAAAVAVIACNVAPVRAAVNTNPAIAPTNVVPVALFTMTMTGVNLENVLSLKFVDSESCANAASSDVTGTPVDEEFSSTLRHFTASFPGPGGFTACVLFENTAEYVPATGAITVIDLFVNRAFPTAGTCCRTDADCNSVVAFVKCINQRCTMERPPIFQLAPPECTSKYECPLGQECRYGQCVNARERYSNFLRGFFCNTKYECLSPNLECVFGGCALIEPACTFIEVAYPDSSTWTLRTVRAPTNGRFVTGPPTPPLGVGSVRMEVGTEGVEFLTTHLYGGVRLADLYRLNYAAFYSPGASPINNRIPAALFLAVDYGVSGQIPPPDQGYLLYNPGEQVPLPSMPPETWLRTNALSPAARWIATNPPGSSICGAFTRCTWAQVLAAFPNARIHPTATETIRFQLGGFFDFPMINYIDDFQINTDRWNFEPTLFASPAGECCFDSSGCIEGTDCVNQRCTWTSTQNVPFADPLGTECTNGADCTGGEVCSYGFCVPPDTPQNRNQMGKLCNNTFECQSPLLVCVSGQCNAFACVG